MSLYSVGRSLIIIEQNISYQAFILLRHACFLSWQIACFGRILDQHPSRTFACRQTSSVLEYHFGEPFGFGCDWCDSLILPLRPIQRTVRQSKSEGSPKWYSKTKEVCLQANVLEGC